ncbi:Large exoprotein involved in heme utilization or adhesion [Yersinia frederiksenii ATCC 33641]|nr:Large exoprotein involved in heme utilization or adhesion [Yersinia frederiksenii ATCC 33641]
MSVFTGAVLGGFDVLPFFAGLFELDKPPAVNEILFDAVTLSTFT